MAIFQFQMENTHFTLKGGRHFTNGGSRVMTDIPEGEIADLLRENGRGCGIQELGFIPHESLHRYTKESNEDAHYPLPDFEGKRVVIVGRGVSSQGYRERYDDSYVVCGVNPASIPKSHKEGTVRNDPTDGLHAGDYSFDCVVSLDNYYFRQEYTKQYKGPVVGTEANRVEYGGPGTYHSADKFLTAGPSLSFGLALYFVAPQKPEAIILCGCDFTGAYEDSRGKCQATIEWTKKLCPVYIDSKNKWKPIGVGVWNA